PLDRTLGGLGGLLRLRDLLARSAVRGRGRVSVLARPVALPRSSAVVGRVKPRAFEMHRDGVEHALERTFATDLTPVRRRVGHALKEFERMPVWTAILVDGHGARKATSGVCRVSFPQPAAAPARQP